MERRYTYTLEMDVPRGIRRGRLLIEIFGNIVRGRLEMFSNITDILSGTYKNGRVEFEGKMKTLMYSMNYRASGRITKRHAELDFSTEKGMFHASGEQDTLSGMNISQDE